MPRRMGLATPSHRRPRRSLAGPVLILLAVLLVAFIIYLSMMDTQVPQTRIEQDVTNVLAPR